MTDVKSNDGTGLKNYQTVLIPILVAAYIRCISVCFVANCRCKIRCVLPLLCSGYLSFFAEHYELYVPKMNTVTIMRN